MIMKIFIINIILSIQITLEESDNEHEQDEGDDGIPSSSLNQSSHSEM